MGDAYTALADDEYTLFYNPAALGRHSGLTVNLVNPHFGITNALDEMDRFEDFPSSDAVAISERIIGFPIFLQAGITPGMKMGNLGFSLIANSTSSITLRNRTHPFLDVNYRYDRGFVAGYAYTWGQKGRGTRHNGKYRIPSGITTSIGASVKHIKREGIDNTFDLFGTQLLNTIRAGVEDAADLKESLGYSKGSGWGVDLGMERVWSNGTSSIILAGSILDVGGTKFKKTSGTDDVPEQDMWINAGVSWKQDFMLFDYSLSLDLHPLNEDMDFGRKLHIGAKIGIPIFDFYGGIGSGYLSYGVGINFWPFRLIAGFYSTELGYRYKQQKGSRAIIYLSLFDFSFDT
jgi:hypothetical protein